ncbi:MAG: tRNA lysidine(34) synthetase TilS [Lachnospiraceae bacterium]|nr:tRNA lysidine(34) synthetase TilS [Lachnospiraceae bacterium]
MVRPEFEERVYNWIEEEGLLPKGDGVLMGVSGGADSVALLRFFCRMAERGQWTLRCVHVEHGLRGRESLADAEFVKHLCRGCDIACQVISVGEQIASMEDTHMSLEEKARFVRYEALEQQARNMEEELGRPVHIAVAHHANDNVETMLFHLARGTGLDGMRGMPAARGRIVRPFLQVSRQEIEDYLGELHQDYCRDYTNEDTTFQRNRIRHEVIPQLEKVNARAVCHMGRTARLVGEVADYLGKQAREILQQIQVEEGKEIRVEPLRLYPAFMQREVVHLWLQQHIPGARNISFSQIAKIVELFDAQVGRQYYLPKGMVVRRTYQGIKITCESFSGQTVEQGELLILEEDLCMQNVEMTYGKYHIFFRLRDWDGTEEIPGNLYTKCFDYDKIKNNVSVRTRHSGDYITITAEGAHKSLQDYFVNEKVPADRRDEIPLLCDGSHVIWVMGYRISEHYKISNQTQKVLEVHMIEEKENERDN